MDANNDETVDYAALSDEELAALAKKHDQNAFRGLTERYMKPILNFARQYAKDGDDAEDIAQDSFFKAWKHIKRFHSGRKWRPWIYAIARNTALDLLKKKSSMPFSDLDDDENEFSFAETIKDPEPLPDELLDNKDAAKRLGKALEKIRPDYRATIRLYYAEDMTFEEIAVVIGRPMNTVKSWHRRAVAVLKKLLEEETG